MTFKDIETRRAYDRKYYANFSQGQKERKVENGKRSRIRNKQYIQNYLKTHNCIDCGESDPIVLDFDHLRNKKFNLADAARNGYSLEKIKEEIDKCEVRCANCHRRITHKRRSNPPG